MIRFPPLVTPPARSGFDGRRVST